MAGDGERVDPEVQAGRALRRLRLSQGWSQEEVARRMRVFGYDFHQTMIAKMDAAQRPLRVRELVDFATLFGVEVNLLIQPPPNGSLDDIDQEIAELEEALVKANQGAQATAENLRHAEAAVSVLRREHEAYQAETAMLAGRLGFLHKEREKFARSVAEQELPRVAPTRAQNDHKTTIVSPEGPPCKALESRSPDYG